MKLVSIIIASCFFILFSTSSLAYRYATCSVSYADVPMKWRNTNPYLDYELAGLQYYSSNIPTNSARLAVLKDAVKTFNKMPAGLKIVLNESRSNQLPTNFDYNGRSELLIANLSYFESLGYGDEARGYAAVWADCSRAKITEVDVYLRDDLSTSSSASNSIAYETFGTKIALKPAALHEFGHLAGLNHTPNTYSVMGNAFNHLNRNGNRLRFYMGEDASHGLTRLYGTYTEAKNDVGVSHFKYAGWNLGGYAQHTETEVQHITSRTALSSARASDGIRRFYVDPGQAVRVEFTYENNGKDMLQWITADYYISTNNIISKYDTFLQRRYLDLSRDKVLTKSYPFTIPTNLSRGSNHYFGVIMDRDNRLTENDESNNKTFVAIHVYGCVRALNSAHVAAGRLRQCGSVACDYRGTSLGSLSTTTTIKESTNPTWRLVSSC